MSVTNCPIQYQSFFIININIYNVFILIFYGPVYIEPSRILGDLIWGNSLTDSEKIIIYNRRIPITLGALASGCLLGLSGFLYQLLLRNPMGDPYVMGVASISYLSLVFLVIHFYSYGFLLHLYVAASSNSCVDLLSYIYSSSKHYLL
jgi:ABC-type enterobactin transport system, permease component